jgi:quercetin dioxygenase-like cupin family protein
MMHPRGCQIGGYTNEGWIIVRRIPVVLSIVVVLLLGGLKLQLQPGVFAQDATPAAGPVGVTAELLGSGETTAAPGHELSLRRVSIAPGGGIPAHTHPGALVIYLESGTWGYTALSEGTQLTRAATNGTPGPTEEMAVGEEIILNAGDWLYVEDPSDDIRNAGDEPVVLFIAGLTRVGEPFTTIMTDMDMGSTPTP